MPPPFEVYLTCGLPEGDIVTSKEGMALHDDL